MSPSDRELVIEKTSNYVWFLVASRLPPKLCISGAILVEAFEPVCENFLIPAARVQALRLIIVLLGGRQCRMPENVYDAANMCWVVGCNSGRGAVAEEMHPKMLSKGCAGVPRDPVGDRFVRQWSARPGNPNSIAIPRCSTPPSREQDRSVVIEVSIEISDLGSRDAGFDRLAPLYLATIEMQTITRGLANEVAPQGHHRKIGVAQRTEGHEGDHQTVPE